jgi:hypothetical protein
MPIGLLPDPIAVGGAWVTVLDSRWLSAYSQVGRCIIAGSSPGSANDQTPLLSVADGIEART